MSLPNGVNPRGSIEAICPDASLMGNRGILHESLYGPVLKDWQHKAWLACRLGFGDWKRGVRVDGKFLLKGSPCLSWNEKVWHWSAQGYKQNAEKVSRSQKVKVLTPRSMLDVLRAGYCVQVHKTAAFA